MNLEREYLDKMFAGLDEWSRLLPTEVQRTVRLAKSVRESNGYPTPEEFRAAIGTSNWVLARRTPRIVARYGGDVLCITPKQYEEASRKAIEAREPK